MKKFLAGLFAILFITLSPLVIISTLIQVRLLTPDGFKQAVRALELGEELPKLIGNFIAEQAAQEEGEGVDVFLQFGGREVFEQALHSVFPPSDVYAILDSVIDQGFIWWTGGQPIQNLELTIDLSSAKHRLAPVILDSVTQQLEALPECTQAELEQLTNSLDAGDVSLSCRPPGLTIDDLLAEGISTDQLTSSVLSNVPDKFDVHEFFIQMNQSDPEQLIELNNRIDSVRSIFRLARLALFILQISCVFSFVLVGLLRLTTLRSFFTWIGIMLLIPGIELSLTALIAKFFPRFFQQRISNYPPGLTETLSIDVFSNFILDLFLPTTLILGVSMTSAGICLLIASRLLGRQQYPVQKK